ncbi:MAG: hypothetical protein AVDCRST_MAG71-427 [uncultured Lysobacter sp.]|uniref:Uncharacterized protein n=1 Tax=uncultured Lysobacter sp. TaxID=271060 RepID=A0A6J4KI11_9GAMM|nr:MAG: hypothetical protein AVDCRST_MAG71-427 [uncultured Lysobacter sp.]
MLYERLPTIHAIAGVPGRRGGAGEALQHFRNIPRLHSRLEGE